MNEPATLGAYLKRERERRGLALRTISESTKVSLGLLEGLEADDISRWPGGIFRRAFVRSYAQCVGLEPDEVVRRFELQHPSSEPVLPLGLPPNAASSAIVATGAPQLSDAVQTSRRTRVLGTAADLTVALVLAFASAAAGSRLLWPVLLIASYYAIGILLTGTSPMVALLNDQRDHSEALRPRTPSGSTSSADETAPVAVMQSRPQTRRPKDRPRHRRDAAARA